MISWLLSARAWILVITVAAGMFEPATALACGWGVFLPSEPGGLFGIAGLSPTDLWTVGDRGTAGGSHLSLTEHWDGTTWSVVSSVNAAPKDGLLRNAVVSANDMWA